MPRRQAERLLATCEEWQFDAFALAKATQGHPLSALSFYLFQRHGLIERFSINRSVLTRWGASWRVCVRARARMCMRGQAIRLLQASECHSSLIGDRSPHELWLLARCTLTQLLLIQDVAPGGGAGADCCRRVFCVQATARRPFPSPPCVRPGGAVPTTCAPADKSQMNHGGALAGTCATSRRATATTPTTTPRTRRTCCSPYTLCSTAASWCSTTRIPWALWARTWRR